MPARGEYQLKDGGMVLLRQAVPEDFPAVARLFTELSQESFRSRFQAGQLAPAVVSGFARIDQPPGTVSVVAAMAHDPGRLAAEARYVPIGDDVAELGLTVLDSHQGAGRHGHAHMPGHWGPGCRSHAKRHPDSAGSHMA